MPLINRSIPGLFGGVSQQIPAMRHPTHCEEQVNAVASLAVGLTSRAGINHISKVFTDGANGASITGAGTNLFVHPIDNGPGQRYWLTVAPGNLMVYDMNTGTAKVVTFPDGKTYLNGGNPYVNIRAVTVADYTFIVNRTVPTGLTGALSPSAPVNRGVVYVKQALAASTYKVTVDGVTASYTSDDTPSVSEIVTGLTAALTGALTGYTVTTLGGDRPGFTVTRNSGAATVVTVGDSYGNTLLKAVHSFVEQYSDLPANLGSLADFVTRVAGNPSIDRGAYWVTWDVARQEYLECAAPGLAGTLDPATMPHKLVRNLDGTFTFSRITDWTPRKSGDAESNPLPSFVGSPVHDVFFFRNRLGLVGPDSVALSKAGRYYTYFGDSALQVLDTDPIDLSSPLEQSVPLEWAVPFDDVLLVTNSKFQLKLVGGEVLSPKNARLLRSSAYAMSTLARPEPLGNKCIFTTQEGSFSSVWELSIDGDSDTTLAVELAEHVPSYIPSGVRHIRANPVSKMLVLLPEEDLAAYHLKYEEDSTGKRKEQRAWSKIQRDVYQGTQRFLGAHWIGETLWTFSVFRSSQDSNNTARFCIESLDFMQASVDPVLDFRVLLDRKGRALMSLSGTDTRFTVPYVEAGEMRYVLATGTSAPVPITPISTTLANGEMTVTLPGDLRAYTVWYGKEFKAKYTFTEIFFRDRDGNPMQHLNMSLKKVLLRYVNSGPFKATVTLPFRDPYVYQHYAEVVGEDPTKLLRTGDFLIPVEAPAAEARITIETTSFYPVTFPYAEWTGHLVMKAQR